MKSGRLLLSIPLFFFLISYLSGSVRAVHLTNESLLYYYDGSTLDEKQGSNYDLGLSGNPTYDTGIIGNAYSVSANNYYYNQSIPLPITNSSYNFWFKATSFPAVYNGLIGRTGLGTYPTPIEFYFRDASNDLNFNFGEDTAPQSFDSVVISFTEVADVWTMITGVKYGNEYRVYVNGTLAGNKTSAQVLEDSPGSYPFVIGQTQAGVYLVGQIDEIGVWNKSLTQDDIDFLWNSGTGQNYDDTAGNPTPTLTINTNFPKGNNTDDPDILITYNATFNHETTTLLNCTLYYNSTSVNESLNVNLSTPKSFNYSYSSDLEGKFTFELNCSNFENSDGSGIFWYSIDLVDPVILSDFHNQTVYNESDTLQLRFNVTDVNLFAVNWTFFNSDGSVYDNQQYFVENITSTFFSNLTQMTFNSSITGDFNIRIETWDSHTKRDVRELKIGKSDTYVQLDDYIFIEGIADSKFKLEDNSKYEMTLYFEKESNRQVWYVRSTKGIYLVPNSKYKGHMVIFDLKRYIDFESDNIKSLEVYKDSQGYRFEALLYRADSEIEFKSIGDLNYVSLRYSYTVQNQADLDTGYLASIDSNISKIYEVINLIPLVMIYIAFMTLGYWMIRTGNLMLGVMFILQSIGFDFLFIGYYYSVYSPLVTSGVTGSFYWFFILSMITWIIVKVFGLLTMRVLIRQLE